MNKSHEENIAIRNERSGIPASIPADFADVDHVEHSTGCGMHIVDFLSEGGILVFGLPATTPTRETHQSVPAWTPAGRGE
jgi:hypothetical protein